MDLYYSPKREFIHLFYDKTAQRSEEMKESKRYPSSKAFLEEVSRYCHNQLTLYTFNRHTLDIDERYREGRITALNYIAELSFYFMQQEKRLTDSFLEELERQLRELDPLCSPHYRQGIRDSIEALQREFGGER
jgi:hypothetical protein